MAEREKKAEQEKTKQDETKTADLKQELLENMSLEEAFGMLDALLEVLESRDITLEDSFQAYQQGMELIRRCNEKLDLVEKKIQIIDEEGEMHDFS